MAILIKHLTLASMRGMMWMMMPLMMIVVIPMMMGRVIERGRGIMYKKWWWLLP